MLAFTDEGIARILIAATRFEDAAARTAMLRKFSYLAARRPSENPISATRNAPAPSPDAERMRRYYERTRRGVAIVPVPVDGALVGYLVREGLLRRTGRSTRGRRPAGRSPPRSNASPGSTDAVRLLRVCAIMGPLMIRAAQAVPTT